jgi:hypothetical protein
MEPLEQLRAKIDGFPGYDGDDARRLSDEYVRSYLGEALASLAARHVLPPELQQRLDELVLRVGFADPRVIMFRHTVTAEDGTDDGGAVAAADAATVALGDRAASLEPASAAAYLDDVAKTLDIREAAIHVAATTGTS